MRTDVHWGLEGCPEVAYIATSFTLDLKLFCTPSAGIQILTSSKFRMQKKFHAEKIL